MIGKLTIGHLAIAMRRNTLWMWPRLLNPEDDKLLVNFISCKFWSRNPLVYEWITKKVQNVYCDLWSCTFNYGRWFMVNGSFHCILHFPNLGFMFLAIFLFKHWSDSDNLLQDLRWAMLTGRCLVCLIFIRVVVKSFNKKIYIIGRILF